MSFPVGPTVGPQTVAVWEAGDPCGPCDLFTSSNRLKPCLPCWSGRVPRRRGEDSYWLAEFHAPQGHTTLPRSLFGHHEPQSPPAVFSLVEGRKGRGGVWGGRGLDATDWCVLLPVLILRLNSSIL